jgi:hypothetical protein
MTGQTNIERRTFLQSITAASDAALSSSLLSHRPTAQPLDKATSAASDHFETAEIRTDDNTIFIRRYGNGSPLLWISSNQPDVARYGATSREQPHGDLCRSSRLWPQRCAGFHYPLRLIIQRRCAVSQCLMSYRSRRRGATPMQSSL